MPQAFKEETARLNSVIQAGFLLLSLQPRIRMCSILIHSMHLCVFHLVTYANPLAKLQQVAAGAPKVTYRVIQLVHAILAESAHSRT